MRIHQDDIQEKMFEVLGFTKEKAYEQFGFLLDSIQVWCTASRRSGLWSGSSGYADGKTGQYP